MHNTNPSLFEEYLLRQPAARRLEIRAAERAYAKEHGARLATATRVFRECMTGLEETYRFEDQPSSSFTPRGRATNQPVIVSAGGNWSWQPLRDDVATERGTFKTFHGVPPSAAELYGRKSYSAA